MHDNTRRWRVGLLVLGIGALFVVLIAFIAGSSLQREFHTYFIRFDENVKGMVVGSKVNFQGVPIGAVHDIRFDAGHTLVEIRVDPNKATVQTATRARLDRLLVTGQVTIELEGWEGEAASLAEFDLIRSERSDPIEELKTNLPSVLAKVEVLVDRTTDVVARVERFLSPENEARVGRVLDATEKALVAVPDELARTSAELRAAIASFRPLADDVRTTLAKFDAAVATEAAPTAQALRAAIGAVERGAGALELSAEAIERAAVEAQGILGGNRAVLRSLLLGANDTVRELRAVARQIRAAPQSFVFGADQTEIELPASPVGGGR